jgi:hypothetical protein
MWFGQAEEVLERSFRFSDGFRYLDSQQEALSIELELGRALAFHGLGDLQAAREAASNAERLVSKMPIDDLQRDQVLARVRELASIVGLKIRST